ncbi:protein MIZU-KUSSEI 1-like [Papaver somniferum]|uniref:protein MIZU-KUSSEI 1-like n=1 Tax=Papaver somniferum TaxID=3469 RepID=UPI000E6F4A62|nr:protein MIZU-KUSSEI 1-like [Papaver somniferum]
MAVTRTGGGVHIVDGVTSVDCHNRVRSWSLLRSVLWFIIPSCNRNYSNDQQLEKRRGDYYYNNKSYLHYLQPSRSRSVSTPFITKTNTNIEISTTRINNVSTGTIYAYRHGKVNLCIQSNPNSNIPTLLLELAIPTAILAKEMRSGLLRIALECSTESRHSSFSYILSVPVWTMYCNGRKVGSAMKRVPTQADKKVLSLMRNVDEGVGIINGKTLKSSIYDKEGKGNQYNHDDLLYLRASFERVCGSEKSESFHLINRDGSNSQQLSIFFIRTR